MLLSAPPLSPLSHLFHSQLHRKVMNDSSGLRGGKGLKDSIWALWNCEHLKLWEFEDGKAQSCWVVGWVDWEYVVNMRGEKEKNKCLFAPIIVWVFLKDPVSPGCFHHASSLSFKAKKKKNNYLHTTTCPFLYSSITWSTDHFYLFSLLWTGKKKGRGLYLSYIYLNKWYLLYIGCVHTSLNFYRCT